MKTDLVVAGYLIHEGKVLLIKHKKLALWLPVGGHIEPDEVPDDALIREFMEEVGLKVKIISQSEIPSEGNERRKLCLPIHVNVHPVGDHDHCCLFYVCKTDDANINMNKSEITEYAWFSKEELENKRVPLDVRNIALAALNLEGYYHPS